MAWFMSSATAGDKGNLGTIPVIAHDNVDMGITVETRESICGVPQHSVYGFSDQGFLGIDELNH